jgi:DNA polymerase III epsilon subunit-like protein
MPPVRNELAAEPVSTNLAVIDTETTGISAAFGHRIIEVGILRIEAGRAVARYQQLLDPMRPISPAVTWLTGITQEMVAGQPRFAEQLPGHARAAQGRGRPWPPVLSRLHRSLGS